MPIQYVPPLTNPNLPPGQSYPGSTGAYLQQAEYDARRSQQQQMLSQEIIERQAEIDRLTAKQSSSYWAGLDYRSKHRVLKDIAQAQGELEYLTQAQRVVREQGVIANVSDFESGASQYAKSTPEYQELRRQLIESALKRQFAKEQREGAFGYFSGTVEESQGGEVQQTTSYEKGLPVSISKPIPIQTKVTKIDVFNPETSAITKKEVTVITNFSQLTPVQQILYKQGIEKYGQTVRTSSDFVGGRTYYLDWSDAIYQADKRIYTKAKETGTGTAAQWSAFGDWVRGTAQSVQDIRHNVGDFSEDIGNMIWSPADFHTTLVTPETYESTKTPFSYRFAKEARLIKENVAVQKNLNAAFESDTLAIESIRAQRQAGTITEDEAAKAELEYASKSYKYQSDVAWSKYPEVTSMELEILKLGGEPVSLLDKYHPVSSSQTMQGIGDIKLPPGFDKYVLSAGLPAGMISLTGYSPTAMTPYLDIDTSIKTFTLPKEYVIKPTDLKTNLQFLVSSTSTMSYLTPYRIALAVGSGFRAAGHLLRGEEKLQAGLDIGTGILLGFGPQIVKGISSGVKYGYGALGGDLAGYSLKSFTSTGTFEGVATYVSKVPSTTGVSPFFNLSLAGLKSNWATKGLTYTMTAFPTFPVTRILGQTLKYGIVAGLPAGIGGLTGYAAYKRTGDINYGFTAGIATATTIYAGIGYYALKDYLQVGQIQMKEYKGIPEEIYKKKGGTTPFGKQLLAQKNIANARQFSIGIQREVVKKGWFSDDVLYSSATKKGTMDFTELRKLLLAQGYGKTQISKMLTEYRRPSLVDWTKEGMGKFEKDLRVSFIKGQTSMDLSSGVLKKQSFLNKAIGTTKGGQFNIYRYNLKNPFESKVYTKFNLFEKSEVPWGFRGLSPIKLTPTYSVELVDQQGAVVFRLGGTTIPGRKGEFSIIKDIIGKEKTLGKEFDIRRTTKVGEYKIGRVLREYEIKNVKIEPYQYFTKEGKFEPRVRVTRDVITKFYRGKGYDYIAKGDLKEYLKSGFGGRDVGAYYQKPTVSESTEVIIDRKITEKGRDTWAIVKEVGGKKVTIGGINLNYQIEGIQGMQGLSDLTPKIPYKWTGRSAFGRNVPRDIPAIPKLDIKILPEVPKSIPVPTPSGASVLEQEFPPLYTGGTKFVPRLDYSSMITLTAQEKATIQILQMQQPAQIGALAPVVTSRLIQQPVTESKLMMNLLSLELQALSVQQALIPVQDVQQIQQTQQVQQVQQTQQIQQQQLQQQLQQQQQQMINFQILPAPQLPPQPRPQPTPLPLVFSFEERKRRARRKLMTSPAYKLAIKRRGKFIPVGFNLTKGEALMRGSDITLRNLARTFKIIPMGTTKEIIGTEEAFMPREAQFRGYQIRKGRRVATPDQYIQRSMANLQSREEKRSIAEAKRLKKLVGFSW